MAKTWKKGIGINAALQSEEMGEFRNLGRLSMT